MKEDDRIFSDNYRDLPRPKMYDALLVTEYLRFQSAGWVDKPDEFALDVGRCARIMQHQADLINIDHLLYFNKDHGLYEETPELARYRYYSEEPVPSVITYGDLLNFRKGLIKWIATEVAPEAERQGVYIPLISAVVEEAQKNGWQIPSQHQQPPPIWEQRKAELLKRQDMSEQQRTRDNLRELVYRRFRDTYFCGKPDTAPLDGTACLIIMTRQDDLINRENIVRFDRVYEIQESSRMLEKSDPKVIEEFRQGLIKWIATVVAPAAKQYFSTPLIPEIAKEAQAQQPQQPPQGWVQREGERREGGQQRDEPFPG